MLGVCSGVYDSSIQIYIYIYIYIYILKGDITNKTPITRPALKRGHSCPRGKTGVWAFPAN